MNWRKTRHIVYYHVMATGKSRKQLLDSARAAFAREPSSTMAEVAAAAGLSMRQLYRLFGSRDNLLRELKRDPGPDARARILEAALEMLGQVGLAELSMDELAERANVSRATLYRLIPGKPALFHELIAAYSPWEPIARVLESAEAATDDAPECVIPNVARALSEALSGRTAVLLRMVFDMARGDPNTAEGVQRAMSRGLPDLITYLDRQMAAGRLRRTHPVLALQLLAGPIVVHELTRALAAMIGFTLPRAQFADEVARSWLRAMAPDDAEPA
jgi:AcrR family transcriptional regulator